jgi:hypothetical protein
MADGGPTPQPPLERTMTWLIGEGRAPPMWRCAITISGYASDAMEERQIGLLLRQNGQQVPNGGQHGHSRAPAIEVPDAKQCTLAKNLKWGHASRQLTLHRLRDGEPEIVSHADFKSLPPVRGGFRVSEFGLHPHLSVAHFDWAGRHIIRPEIERAAARKIEPGMVPVAGQNAVFHASAIEGEPHMRTSVVKGVDAAVVFDDQDRSMRSSHHEPAFGIEIRERACTDEFGVHDHASTPKVPLGKITRFGQVMNQTIRTVATPLNGLAARNVPTGNIARAMGETTRRPMSIPGFRGEIASVQAAKRDAQLAANLARAQLAEEARQLIVGDYARAASGIAATLASLAAIESEVRCSTRASRAALPISKSRRSAGGTVGLSGITSDDADFWPTRPRP